MGIKAKSVQNWKFYKYCNLCLMYNSLFSIIVWLSQHHFRLYDIHEGGCGDVAAVQFPQSPGPPGGTNGLHGALVVELVLPVDSQVGCFSLLTILWILQPLVYKDNVHAKCNTVGSRVIPSCMPPLQPAWF